VSADIEKAAARNLRRTHVSHGRTQIVEVPIVIGLQLTPAVRAVIEIVVKKNVPQRIEFAERRIRLDQRAAERFRRMRTGGGLRLRGGRE
jgi:hypothetical protein